MDETEAVARCLLGDQQGFTELFERYRLRAWRVAYAMTGDRALADDATQEAFVQAFRAIRNLRPDAPFGPWFYALLTNATRRMVKRRRWWLPLFLFHEVPDERADAGLAAAESRSEIWQRVQGLAPELREVVSLRYLLDLSEQEMASILKIPAGTVKSRLHRARELLRKEFSHTDEGAAIGWTN